MITSTIPNYDKAGRKGLPLYYEAHGVTPPGVEVALTPGDTIPIPGGIAPRTISRRQFFQYLAVIHIISEEEALAAVSLGVIPPPLMAIIGMMPEQVRFAARMLVISAQEFDVDNQMAETVRLALGWSEDQKFDFWKKASEI